jgi:hypothetical protein
MATGTEKKKEDRRNPGYLNERIGANIRKGIIKALAPNVATDTRLTTLMRIATIHIR